MRMTFARLAALGFCIVLPVISSLSGCRQESRKAALQFTDQEFILRQDTDHSYVVDARGKMKNIGPVDVKNVQITGYCRSCGEVLISGKWFISDYEKTPEQRDIINYLPAGREEEFKFKGVAFYMDQSGKKPALPEEMEIVVESYEIVE